MSEPSAAKQPPWGAHPRLSTAEKLIWMRQVEEEKEELKELRRRLLYCKPGSRTYQLVSLRIDELEGRR